MCVCFGLRVAFTIKFLGFVSALHVLYLPDLCGRALISLVLAIVCKPLHMCPFAFYRSLLACAAAELLKRNFATAGTRSKEATCCVPAEELAALSRVLATLEVGDPQPCSSPLLVCGPVQWIPGLAIPPNAYGLRAKNQVLGGGFSPELRMP